jgi:hypothetical protein
LLVEKVIQHVLVSLAFYFNWTDIAASVAVNPTTLLVLGSIVAILFVVALWGMIHRERWAIGLAQGLALFDIVGEFAAQGTFAITITLSFLVAWVLLIAATLYRRQEDRSSYGA